MFRETRTHPFWRRLQDRPFAAALGALLLTSPIITAAGASLTTDPLNHLVPSFLFYALLTMYGAAGLCLVLGIGLEKTNIEAAGCILAISGLAVRMIALFSVIGFTVPVLATTVFYVVFGGACVERLMQCIRGEHIVRVSNVVSLEDDPDGD